MFARNSAQVFDIEIQTTDTGELPERARYYQSAMDCAVRASEHIKYFSNRNRRVAMDIDCLKTGQDYKDLKNSYVIFICIPDIFHKGLPVYTFENLCRQDTTIPLGDRTIKSFFISANCDKLLNEEQKAFMRLVSGGGSSNSFTDRVAHLTEDAKQNNEYRRQYMEWERQKAYEYKRGKQEGKEEAKIEGARKMLANGKLSNEEISDISGLPLEQVQKLQAELSVAV